MTGREQIKGTLFYQVYLIKTQSSQGRIIFGFHRAVILITAKAKIKNAHRCHLFCFILDRVQTFRREIFK